MQEATSVLFGLDDFEVVQLERVRDRLVRVSIQSRWAVCGQREYSSVR
jgi:hypothetical protein